MTAPIQGEQPPAGCAIITRDYLSYARVLAESFRRHNEGAFYVLALDGLPPGTDPGPDIRLVSPTQLDCPWFWEMCCRYNRIQLSCALKPFLLSFVLECLGESRVFYFDSDIVVYSRLIDAERTLDHADMLLTPHILQPIPRDGLQPDELYILSGGVYNMGFFAMRRSPESRRILTWWSSRLRDLCGSDLGAGMYLDQRWADLIPALFPSVEILRDSAYNVAFWNLHERSLSETTGGPTVNGRPLACFHFSGVDLQTGLFRESFQTRHVVAQGTPIATLITDYVERHERHGLRECLTWQSPFECFDNGLRFHPIFRQLYLAVDDARRQAFGDPFATSPGSFFEWAMAPDDQGWSPFLRQLQSTAIAQEQFSGLPEAEAEFVAWVTDEGAAALDIDAALAARLASA